MSDFAHSSDSDSGSGEPLTRAASTFSEVITKRSAPDLVRQVKDIQAVRKKAQDFIDSEIADKDDKEAAKCKDLFTLLSPEGQEALRELFNTWKEIDPEMVVQVLKCLGPADHVVFFRSLVLHIPHPSTHVTRQPMSFTSDALDGNFSFSEDGIDQSLLLRSQAKLKRRVADLVEGTKEVRTSYTETRSLLRCSEDRDLIFMLNALIESGNSAFDNVFVNCIVSEAWKNCSVQFGVDRACDIALITNLAFVATYGRSAHHCEVLNFTCNFIEHVHLEPWLLVMVMTLACACMLRATLYTAGAIRLFGWRFGLFQTFSHWGLATTLIEVFTFFVLLRLCAQHFSNTDWNIWRHNDDENSYLVKAHPALLAAVVLSRWLQLVLSLMSTGLFGDTVLPAFNAVLGRNSRSFLLFLAICWCGCVNAYFVFPIPGDVDFVAMSVKIFRLAFLGDFDLWELEGKDPEIEFNLTNSNSTVEGKIQDPKSSRFYHLGLQLFFTVVSCFFTILMMNVYIGVLGNEYNDQKVNSRVGTLKLRAQVLVQLLEVREMLPFTRQLSAFNDTSQQFNGLWILWAPEAILKVQEDDEAAQLDEAVGGLEAKLDKMETLLAAVCHVPPEAVRVRRGSVSDSRRGSVCDSRRGSVSGPGAAA